ncbi:MAG: DNA repair protein RadA, partial [Deltaproteobacteria bacterium]|nr:DNA repair protein RadA [Deltaproteobacteria bacterium]
IRESFLKKTSTWTTLEDSQKNKTSAYQRLHTGISELDRVLGGGLVPDSFVLLGGDPGIGKSTLILQVANGLINNQNELKLLYISGEESVEQIALRANRLQIHHQNRFFLASETELEPVFEIIKELKPQVLFMDSLQTFSTQSISSAPGNAAQLREVTARLMTLAKSAGICIWMVGHVTKDGAIAGPKMVEHMVDTVLYFEGDGTQDYRLLRTVKNRFGSTQELGVFEMTGQGLKEILNPSSFFLSERKEPTVGTTITVSLEGTRPIFVELQALVIPSGLAMPRRTAVGVDHTKISLLTAILERHLRLPLSQKDVFFNVSGGLKLSEPASDLAAIAAIWSSHTEKTFPLNCVFMGEVGLTGEVRTISQLELRLQEAKKLGFKTVILPNTSHKTLDQYKDDLKFIQISNVSQISKILA